MEEAFHGARLAYELGATAFGAFLVFVAILIYKAIHKE
jgi:hypothetical protein